MCVHYVYPVKNVYEVTGAMMRFCILLSMLEIVHVQLKIVKASTLPTVTQVSVVCVCVRVCVCVCVCKKHWITDRGPRFNAQLLLLLLFP